MNYLLSGNIYLKNNPEILDENDVMELRSESYASNGEELNIAPGYKDWENTDKFLKLIVLNNQKYLLSKCLNMYDAVLKSNVLKVTDDELLYDYESITDIMDEDKFIGKYAHMIRPSMDGDQKFQNQDVILLYKSKYHIIYVESYIFSKVKLGILNKNYLNDWMPSNKPVPIDIEQSAKKAILRELVAPVRIRKK